MSMKRAGLLAIIILAAAGVAHAQGQLSASGSYLKGTGDNKAGLWGGGLNGKLFLGNQLAVGVGFSTYPSKTREIKGNSGSSSWTYNSADLVTNVAAGLDILLAPRTEVVQPYIGVDGGVSFNQQTASYISSTTQISENKNKESFFLLSPKLGVNIGIGQAFGLFGQAKYNFTFGDGNLKSISINNIPNPITTQPVSKYFSFDAGIYIRLKGA